MVLTDYCNEIFRELKVEFFKVATNKIDVKK